MKQVWSVFIQDLKNIKRVPLMGILLIGLAILPSLYAWFNLSASWDPYSNTSEIKIAVVNEDEGAEIDGKEINIGEELVENLKDNDKLGWTIVSKDDAERGVEYGTYYASVYINKMFSEDLAKVIDGEPQSAEILYEVNEKLNAIAPKMTSAGATTIANQISEQFIGEASKALFTEFNSIGLKLEEELPTIRRLEAKLFELEARIPEINKFGAAVIEIDSDWDIIRDKANQFLEFKEFIPQINEGADQILALEKRLPQINKLGEKILELEQEIPKIEDASKEISKINDHFSEIEAQLDEALTGVKTAQKAIERAKTALPFIEETAESTAGYVEALSLFVDRAQGAAEPVIAIVLQNTQLVQQTAAAINETLTQLENSDTPEKAMDALKKLNEQLISSLTLIQNATEMFESLNKYLPSGSLQPAIDYLTNLQSKIESLQIDVQKVINAGGAAKDAIPAIREKAQAAERVAAELNSYLNNGGSEAIISALDSIQKKALEASDTLVKVQENLPNVKRILDNAQNITVIGEERLNELINVFPEVKERLNELIERIEKDLPVAIKAIHDASGFVREDLPGIEDKIHEVATFIRNDLQTVEKEYTRISALLEEHMPEIEEAIHGMAEFAKLQLPEFEEKVGTIADRMRQFDKEHDLGELISLLKNDMEKESAFFSKPVHLIEEKIFPIPNYGSANAPFYTALCLWVGALLLSNLLSTNVHPIDKREDYTVRHMYLGRLLLFLVVGILQALIVSLGNLFILDAYAAHPFLIVIFTILIAMVFTIIVYTLASVFGNIGKAMAVVLMVLQLSGAGGTFPIQVAPPFFQAIHPFLPFTYAINLLREAVGGIVPSITWTQIGVLVGFGVLAIVFGLLLKEPLLARINKTAEKSKSSRLME